MKLIVVVSNDPTGFNNTLTACCGGGGPYDYDSTVGCGQPKSTVCDDPTSYVNWDGKHLTEAAYEAIAHMLLQGKYSTPRINGLCVPKGPSAHISDH
nr:GDSL esterase/lipase At1g28610-like [Ipomoea trifida]